MTEVSSVNEAQSNIVSENSAPIVSVIMPTYNPDDRIRQAVDSVLSQDISKELIVVDDGSTVNVEVLLGDLLERIRLIRQANRGAAGAKNRGLREATGRYVAFLDDDDTWLPGSLRDRVRCFENHAYASVVLSGRLSLNSEGELKPWVKVTSIPAGETKEIRKEEFCRIMRMYGYFSLEGSLSKLQTMLQVGGFDEELYVGEDFDLLFRLMRHKPVVFMQKPTFVCIRSGLTVDPTGVDKRRRSMYRMVRKHVDYVAECWKPSEAKEFWKFHDTALRQYAKAVLGCGDRTAAERICSEIKLTWSTKNIILRILIRLYLLLPPSLNFPILSRKGSLKR